MTRKSAGRRLLACFALASLMIMSSLAAGQEERSANLKPSIAEAILALKRGEHVIYMRHAATETSSQDQVRQLDLHDCSTQRNLSAAGRRQAIEIGKAMQRLRIPIGEVLVSPYCRTRETAELAFGKALPNPGLLNTMNLTDPEKVPIVVEMLTLLRRPVLPGSNRILVSHSSTLADSTGIFPKPEGVLIVFKPDGNGGFKHIATITPSEWEKLSTVQR